MRELGAFLCLSLMCSCASRSTAVYPPPGNGICEVHHVAMVRKTIPVSFGYPYYEGPFTKAEPHFPHALEDVNGGCDPNIGPKTPRFTFVLSANDWRESGRI